MPELWSQLDSVFLPEPSPYKLDYLLEKRILTGMSSHNPASALHPNDDPEVGFNFPFMSNGDCDGCAPPMFNLPPPPRPPWLEDLEDCHESPSQSELMAQQETCDNTIILNSPFEDTFHSVAVVLVCAFVAVILFMLLAIVIFKRRKGSSVPSPDPRQQHHHFGHPCQRRHEETRGMDSIGPHSVSTFARKDGDSCSTTGGDSLGPHKILFHQAGQLFSSSTNSMASQIKRASHPSVTANLGHMATDTRAGSRPSGGTANFQTLPNHYIQEGPNATRSKGPALAHFPPHHIPTMHLSDQPPSAHHVSHNYPHIIIGGQPFYLIPSDPNSACIADCDADSYAYPQTVPIYEEIDPYATSHDIYPPPSDLVEPGSISGTPNSGHARPHLPRLPARLSGRVMANPLVREVQVQDLAQLPASSLPTPWDRNRSPVGSTCSSTKKSPLASTSGGSSSSSVYYYSDTLKAKEHRQHQSHSPRLSYDDSSDSGLGNQPRNSSNQVALVQDDNRTVDTQIVLESEARNSASSV